MQFTPHTHDHVNYSSIILLRIKIILILEFQNGEICAKAGFPPDERTKCEPGFKCALKQDGDAYYRCIAK